MITKEDVIKVLKECYDPEIPIDLWSLGLIYDIQIYQNKEGNANVKIIMTLTTPGCSMGNHMAIDIKSKLELNKFIDLAEIEITFEPPWTPEMMNDHAQEKLGFSNTIESKKTDQIESWE